MGKSMAWIIRLHSYGWKEEPIKESDFLALSVCIATDNMEAANMLIKTGCGFDPIQLIFVASRMGRLWAFQMPILTQKSVNAKINPTGSTPVYLAAGNGHNKIVQHLLTNGANPTITNNKDETPLEVARRLKYPDVIAVLEEHLSFTPNSGKQVVQDHQEITHRLDEMIDNTECKIGELAEFIFANSDSVCEYKIVGDSLKTRAVQAMIYIINKWIKLGKKKIPPNSRILDLHPYVRFILRNESKSEEVFKKVVEGVMQSLPAELYLGKEKKEVTFSTAWFVGLMHLYSLIVNHYMIE